MFYKAPDQYINEGTQFTIDGVTYPAQWLNNSTPEQKAALGLEEVTTVGELKDAKYYWIGEQLSGSVRTLTATPKDLADVQKQAIAQVNASAYSILLPSDWMVVKAMETSTPVATDWNTWRASIRTTAADTVTAINAATDVDGVATVMANISWPNDPNYVEPVVEEAAEETPAEEVAGE